ncbi:hypothetical protein Fmac_011162 [Flemingia macrophylla]|uniref:Uncharacterized protein n=1 Tax=Flemingia macrophylla TaxID=520843 RepID=A0ABD1MLP2_9FABA
MLLSGHTWIFFILPKDYVDEWVTTDSLIGHIGHGIRVHVGAYRLAYAKWHASVGRISLEASVLAMVKDPQEFTKVEAEKGPYPGRAHDPTISRTLQLKETGRSSSSVNHSYSKGTLEMLNQQGKQIIRTYNMVVDTEKDLSRIQEIEEKICRSAPETGRMVVKAGRQLKRSHTGGLPAGEVRVKSVGSYLGRISRTGLLGACGSCWGP